MKYFYLLAFTVLSFTTYAQSWEELLDDYSLIYDISNHEEKLFIVGVKAGDFIFASSTDEGTTWEEVVISDRISVQSGIPISVGFFNAQEGIIGIKGSLTKEYLKTEDGGATWETYPLNMDEDCDYIPQPWKVIGINDSTALIQHFQSGNLAITHDRGQSWECAYEFSTSWLPKVEILDSSTYLNFDTKGLFKSSDKGKTWTPALNIGDLSTFSMYDQQVGFATSAYYSSANATPELYSTQDGWASVDTSALPALNDQLINAIVPITAEKLFFLEGENMYLSDDAGQSVSLFQTLSFEPTSARKVNGQWYVTGRGLAKYDPDGITTSIAHADPLAALNFFPNPVSHSMIELNIQAFFSYQLYDLQGKLIAAGSTDNGKITFPSAAVGLHLLRIQNRTQSAQKSLNILIE